MRFWGSRFRGVAVVLAFVAWGGQAEAQREVSYDGLAFSTSDQSMWSTGDGFVFDYEERFTESANTGSLPVNPGPVSRSGVTVDTQFAVSAGGEVGVGVGFGVNGGLVDADVLYNASFRAPERPAIGAFFDLTPSASLDPASRLRTSSPSARAYVSGILELYTNLYAEAVVTGGNIINGVENGKFVYRRNPSAGGSLVDVDLDQTLVGFNRNGNGRVVWKAQDVGGPGTVIEIGNPLQPSAILDVGDWRINAEGGVSGDRLTAAGQTRLLDTTIDVDASLTGGSPLTGAGVNVRMSDNIVLDTGYDVIDFDTLLGMRYQQAFELEPTLQTRLTFSEDVQLRDAQGNITVGRDTGLVPLEELPEIALLTESVEVTPQFALTATLENDTDLEFDLSLIFKALEGNFDFDFDSTFYDTSISRSFGPAFLEEVDLGTLPVSVYKQRFAFGEFAQQTGQSFTLVVPEPNSAALLMLASGMAILRRPGRSASRSTRRGG